MQSPAKLVDSDRAIRIGTYIRNQIDSIIFIPTEYPILVYMADALIIHWVIGSEGLGIFDKKKPQAYSLIDELASILKYEYITKVCHMTKENYLVLLQIK